MTKYTQAELDFIQEHCQLGRRELAILFTATFNKSVSANAMRKICSRYKFYSEYKGGCKKGQNSWLNGKPIIIKPKNGFKKGNIPPYKNKVGDEAIRNDGVIVKVAEPNIWQFRSRLVWEHHHGKIPKGYVVLHKDGNILNDHINNLVLLSRLELLQINRLKINQYPQALKDTVVLCGKLLASTMSEKSR